MGLYDARYLGSGRDGWEHCSPIRQQLSHPGIISGTTPTQVVLSFFLMISNFPSDVSLFNLDPAGFSLRISTLVYWEGLRTGWYFQLGNTGFSGEDTGIS